MASLDAALPSAGYYTRNAGVHTYHEGTNRIFLSGPRNRSTTYCWDFDGPGYCGSIYGQENGIETQDYGFWAEGDCMFGVGHHSIFWVFRASDLTSGCPGSTAEVDIFACGCSGDDQWGSVWFDMDIGPTSPFTVLNLQVLDQDGTIVWPDDGSSWISMLDDEDQVLDLSGVPVTAEPLTVRAYVESDDTAPWSAPDPPTMIVGVREAPRLVE